MTPAVFRTALVCLPAPLIAFLLCMNPAASYADDVQCKKAFRRITVEPFHFRYLENSENKAFHQTPDHIQARILHFLRGQGLIKRWLSHRALSRSGRVTDVSTSLGRYAGKRQPGNWHFEFNPKFGEPLEYTEFEFEGKQYGLFSRLGAIRVDQHSVDGSWFEPSAAPAIPFSIVDDGQETNLNALAQSRFQSDFTQLETFLATRDRTPNELKNPNSLRVGTVQISGYENPLRLITYENYNNDVRGFAYSPNHPKEGLSHTYFNGKLYQTKPPLHIGQLDILRQASIRASSPVLLPTQAPFRVLGDNRRLEVAGKARLVAQLTKQLNHQNPSSIQDHNLEQFLMSNTPLRPLTLKSFVGDFDLSTPKKDGSGLQFRFRPQSRKAVVAIYKDQHDARFFQHEAEQLRYIQFDNQTYEVLTHPVRSARLQFEMNYKMPFPDRPQGWFAYSYQGQTAFIPEGHSLYPQIQAFQDVYGIIANQFMLDPFVTFFNQPCILTAGTLKHNGKQYRYLSYQAQQQSRGVVMDFENPNNPKLVGTIHNGVFYRFVLQPVDPSQPLPVIL